MQSDLLLLHIFGTLHNHISMGNISNSNDSEQKGLNYCILSFKKKIKFLKKLTIRSEALYEVSCSFSPEVQLERFFKRAEV